MIFLRSLRHKRWVFLTTRKLQKAIRSAASKEEYLNLNIGSGTVEMDGWINLDLPIFDVTKPESWKKMLGSAQFDNALLEHVFEHLRPDEVEAALRIFKLYMKPGSNIRIAVPDKNHPNPEYIEHTRPGGSGIGADDHKSFWNIDGFKEIAENCGFELIPLEYYASSGELVSNKMNPEKGVIQRSARNELNSPIKDYSSLIFDLRLKQ